jgi:MFS family permease
MKYITRTIVFLSLISLFTDIASEMLYPVMPIYLKSIGFSVLFIGILEGISEATAGLSKGYFGHLSDHLGRRKPFIQAGYTLSAISKPMMALFTHPFWILMSRTTDRLGKGIRTAARDSLLSAETTPEFKGRVFGFHRGFDTLGAAIGPTLAIVFLSFYPEHYKELFLFAVIPGILAVAMTLYVKEKKVVRGISAENVRRPGFFSFLTYWKIAPRDFRLLVVALLAFALLNSSDMLLLLMMKNNGAPDQHVLLVYVFYNIVYALAAFPMGAIGDKLGLRATFIGGLLLFTCVYGGIVLATSTPAMLFLFFLYGLYAAGTEGISKAWITNIVPKNQVATALGFLTSITSICSLLASSIAGFLWIGVGPSTPFLVSAVGTLLVVFYLVVVFRMTPKSVVTN